MVMKRCVRGVRVLVLLALVTAGSAWAQSAPEVLIPYEAPRDSSGLLWSAGAGAGLPYGVMGGKVAVGGSHWLGQLGVGAVPLTWTPAISVGAVAHLRDRLASWRPKFTFAFSTASAAIVIRDETSGASASTTLFDKVYRGFGFYTGMDWRPVRKAPVTLDLNVGWVRPAGGAGMVQSKYDGAVRDLEAQGYTISDEKQSFDSPRFSVGVSYSPGRSYHTALRSGPDPNLDSDHDGIPDVRDREPNTPPGAEVDMYGVSRDDDGDGVLNGIDQDDSTPPGSLVDQFGRIVDADHDGVDDPRDQCPDTQADLLVDASGCPKMVLTRVQQILDKGRVTETRIYFATGQATLLSESYPVLDTIGVTLSQFPSLRVQVGGHCDDRGSDELNRRLSEDRARAVVGYLLAKNPELTAERLTARGFGRTQPVASGTDEESRRLNRRVEFLVLNVEDVSIQKELQDYIRRGEQVPDTTRIVEPAPR